MLQIIEGKTKSSLHKDSYIYKARNTEKSENKDKDKDLHEYQR